MTSTDGEPDMDKPLKIVNLKAYSKTLKKKKPNLKGVGGPIPVKGKTFPEWQEEWIAQNKLEYVYDKEMILLGGKLTTMKSVLNRMVVDLSRMRVEKSVASLRPLMELWVEEQLGKVPAMVRTKLSGGDQVAAEAQVKEFLRCMTGTEDALDLAVMKHFFWQVKRKLHNLKVDYHMMVLFCGEQGNGKTTTTQRLLEPLAPLWQAARSHVFKDTRQHNIFHKCYALLFDDMDSIPTENIETVKSMITNDRISFQPKYANEILSLPLNSTCLGSSNRGFGRIIADDQMRRFYQIDTLPRIELEKNWEKLASLDYQLMWSCVSEKDECPVVVVKEAITKRQNANAQEEY